MPESRADQIARWEREGWLEPDCPACIEEYYSDERMPSKIHAPRHKPMQSCEGAGRPHCTCDVCF